MNPGTSLNVVKNFTDNAGGAHFSTIWCWYNKSEGMLKVKMEWVKGVPSLFGGSYSLAPAHAPEPARPPKPKVVGGPQS